MGYGIRVAVFELQMCTIVLMYCYNYYSASADMVSTIRGQIDLRPFKVILGQRLLWNLKVWKLLDPTGATYDDACVVWGHSPVDIDSHKLRSWKVVHQSEHVLRPGFIIPCPVSEPDNCFALFYFVINACISHGNNVTTLFFNPEIPVFGLS